MKLAPKIAGTALVILTLSGAGVGTAVASSHAPARGTAAPGVTQSEPMGPDTDALQQGSQTSPDSFGASAVKAGSDAKADTPGEQAGSEAASDGPGGHADPAGDVQHEFTGVE